MCSRMLAPGLLLVGLTGILGAQAVPATTSPISCVSCPQAGQRPQPAYDPAKTRVVARVEPMFLPGGAGGPEMTLRVQFIARVLGASPLVLELLDSRVQQLDKAMRVVQDDVRGGADPGTCGIVGMPAMAAESRTAVAALRFNDLVTGAWLMHRDPSAAGAPLGLATVVELRRIAAPIAYFHPTPRAASCLNRSGRLLDYIHPSGGRLTLYNDGGIHYSTEHGHAAAHEGLSPRELEELLGAFGAAGVDTLPDLGDEAARQSGSRLMLAAARHQVVHTDPPDPKLAPVVDRLTTLVARAMASARLVLRTGGSRPIDPGEAAAVRSMTDALRADTRTSRVIVNPDGSTRSERLDLDRLPERASLPAARYRWPGEAGIRLADVPPDGLAVPWPEVARHKPVYYALLNARRRGLTLIDGDRLYEEVRLCQVSETSESC